MIYSKSFHQILYTSTFSYTVSSRKIQAPKQKEDFFLVNKYVHPNVKEVRIIIINIQNVQSSFCYVAFIKLTQPMRKIKR